MSFVTAPYTPPGVSITELSSPTVNPLLASPADVCLVGIPGNPASALSSLSTTDTIILGLNGSTTPVALPTLEGLNNDATLVSVQSVSDVLNPAVTSPAFASPNAGLGYHSPDDYTVQTGESGPDGSAGTITWVPPAEGGAIPENTLVQVTYTYVPTDYWNPIRLFDIGSVQSRFGSAWATATNSSGVTVFTGIHSQLTFAAALAFANGAQSVICQPLFTRATPGDPTTPQQQAVGSAISEPSTWGDTLFVLRPIVNLNIIVPLIGVDGVNVTNDNEVLATFEAVQAHIAYQNSNDLFIVGIFGEDGTASANEAQKLSPSGGVLRQHAAQLQSNFGNKLSSQGVLLNNSIFNVPVPGAQGGVISVGGQYAAAAFAGAIAARNVSSSMTRQFVSGFSSITSKHTPADKNADAGSGLSVVENYNGLIRCRHSITLDIQEGPARQELSVVRAKFLLMESIQQTLDNQIIGQIIADANSPLIVQSAISGVLAQLQQGAAIVGYTPVQARISATNPTVITASFAYQPAFPLNYIKVTFSLDLTSGIITSTTSTTSSTTTS